MEGVFFSDVSGIDPERYLICTYYVETSGSLESAGEAIAAEESIGKWTDIKTIKIDIQRRLLREAANASTTSSEEGDTQRNTIKVRTLSKDPKSILSI